MASRSGLLLMSLASAVIYVSLALVIVRYFHDEPLVHLFSHGSGIAAQLLIGLVFGILAAAGIGFVIWRTPISGILQDYAIVDMVMGMRFTRFDRIQISFFAGTGEELLFRGAMQPVLGIWLTSLIFVAMHGYFKFRSPKHILFGAMMFALSVGLGLLYEWAGLIAAMTAHAVYDLVMLELTHRLPAPWSQKNPAESGGDVP
jgi:uncharacterized protein